MTDNEQILLQHVTDLTVALLSTDRFTVAPTKENPSGLIVTEGKSLVALAAAKIMRDLIAEAEGL